MNLLKRFRPSPAMVIACLALLLALAGTGYAAIKLPRNSVTTVQVKDFSLLARDFKRGQFDDQVGSCTSRRWDRRAVRRHHARSEAECRNVHPEHRKRGDRQADSRLGRLRG